MKAFKYSQYGTNKIFLECNGCLEAGIDPEERICPCCGERFTQIVDEVDLTRKHNAAVEKLNEALKTGDKDMQNEAERECALYGVKRFVLEGWGELV